MFIVFEVDRRVIFSHRTHVTVRDTAVECNAVAVLPVHEFKSAIVEVTEPRYHTWGLITDFIAQVLSFVAISAEVRYGGEQRVVFSAN